MAFNDSQRSWTKSAHYMVVNPKHDEIMAVNKIPTTISEIVHSLRDRMLLEYKF